MTIVLNEKEYAENALRQKTLGAKPFETMCRVAKYYMNEDIPKKEVRDKLDGFLLSCSPGASLPKWSDTLDYAIAAAGRQQFVVEDHIPVTKSEFSVIRAVSGTQTQRLAFTLLCLAKYWKLVNPKADGWVNNADAEIMKIANINTSVKRQCAMYHTLRDEGLIRFSRKIDNTNVQVLFACDDEELFGVSDFRNLGYQYMIFLGDPRYTRCRRCGAAVRDASILKDGTKKSGRKPESCSFCAQKTGMKRGERGPVLPS